MTEKSDQGFNAVGQIIRAFSDTLSPEDVYLQELPCEYGQSILRLIKRRTRYTILEALSHQK